MSKQNPNEKFKAKTGGQAVIEGVMMRGVEKEAMACRLPNGEIDLEVWDLKYKAGQLPFYRKVPFLRGIFNFLDSLIDGYKCLSKSADKQMQDDEDEELTKFEQWLTDKLGDKLMPIISGISLVFGFGLAIVLFMIFPSFISKLIDKYIISLSAFAKNCIEGILKISIFIGYTKLTSLMSDIATTYRYHGAEHKTIACYESGDELSVENVRRQIRFHPRCGTSFIFLVLFISIFVFTVVGVPWDNIFIRMLFKLALLPVIVGIAYELIRLAGRHDNIITRIISAPGLWVQRITTSEPDDGQIECAIAALKAVIPDDSEADRW
ncbi:MAG: DUF1385 domain-containing protein [Ruminococcus sp.]|nr:DUF1385 domain-containing protein [Ruminococcus sp.]